MTSALPPSPRRIEDILPSPFAWIDIPRCNITIEDRLYDVEPFQIAKYPITNAQFKLFIDAGGYQEKRWWTEVGWQAKEDGLDHTWEDTLEPTYERWTQPESWHNPDFNAPEQPVVGVSWYEALAFCNWLDSLVYDRGSSEAGATSLKTGGHITLPALAQWQWAAAGPQQLAYPWGNEWNAANCNHSINANWYESKTTPVQQYEGKGDSSFGVVDMAGNVEEWSLTDYHLPKRTDLNNNNPRVMLGGSCVTEKPDPLRCDHHTYDNPHNRGRYIGFRIVLTFEPTISYIYLGGY